MTTATLRSLYGRATRAFVRRDIVLTHSLLQSAFSILQPPGSHPDPLTDFRRKWDILRITLETLVYTLPPLPTQNELPDELKKMLLESPRVLLKSMYLRSLTLFTPTEGTSAPSPSYLPEPVLLTLVYSSIKMNCNDSGRYMIEEWLVRREPLLLPDSISVGTRDGDSYEKVLETYCLQILPNLEQWDYAHEFLEHETELPHDCRQRIKSTLDSLHTQALASRKTPQPKYRPFTDFSTSSSSSLSTRPASPTPSTSSSSSISTASNHTIKPSNARGRRNLNALSPISALPSASTSTTSLASDTTATQHLSSHYTNGHGNHHHHNGSHHPSKPPPATNRSSSSSSHPSSTPSSPWSSLPFVPHSQTTTFDPSNPSIYALIKTTIASYLSLPKLSTFLIIFVLFPVISFLLRFRHKRRKLFAGGGGASSGHSGVTPLRDGPHAGITGSNADMVRRRLQQIGAGGEGSLIQRSWAEIVRMVVDTVKMAGSGLV